MGSVRSAAVAGLFYPAEPEILARDLQRFLHTVQDPASPPHPLPVPKAIIAPHAGYIYSGPIAASVYARLSEARRDISRVVLFGPSHRVAFAGLAVPSTDDFEVQQAAQQARPVVQQAAQQARPVAQQVQPVAQQARPAARQVQPVAQQARPAARQAQQAQQAQRQAQRLAQ
jgi:AmmeMemoRadiSam system protein B